MTHTDLDRVLSGDSAAVIAELEERLAADAGDAGAWLELGLAYLAIAHHAEAAAALHQAAGLEPERADVRRMLARALRAHGDIAAAAAELAHAARLAPDDVRTQRELGIAYYDLGRHDEAARALGLATRLAPEDARSHYALGVVHEARRDMGAAIACYREAVRRDPRFGAAQKTLADALAQMGELAGAIDELRAVLRFERSNEEVATNIELLERALEDMRRARLLGKPESAFQSSVLGADAGFKKKGQLSPSDTHGAGEVVRYTAKLAEVWLTLGAPPPTPTAPGHAQHDDRPVTRLRFLLTDPERAAKQRDDTFGVIVVSSDGRRLPADYGTGATVAFLRTALGCPLTRASELYQALLADPREQRWGGAAFGFETVARPGKTAEMWHALYVSDAERGE